MTLREKALEYSRMGLAVIPITPNQKKPALMSWKDRARLQPNQVKEIWQKNPFANIAILTGKRSNGLIVVDIDVKKGHDGIGSIKQWQKENGEFPDTWTAKTPSGGYHLYFKTNEDLRNSADVLDGVDLRAEGGYIIAPPSTNELSQAYQWINSPYDTELAQANESVLKLFKVHKKKENPQIKAPHENKNILNPISEGGRTNYLVSIIGQQNFNNNKLSKDSLKELIRRENQSSCNPPLTDEELEKEVFPALERMTPYNKESKQESPPQKLKLMSGKELQEMEIPPLEWLVDDYLPLSGVSGIIGSPKSRKSFMALDLCISIANGTKFLGKNTHKVDTVYFDLESGLRRPKERQNLILAREKAPDNFYIITSEQEVKQLDNGFIDQLIELLETNKNIRFVVIDTLGILRGAKKTDYSLDVDDIKKLKDICTKYDVCIMVIHHFKKGRGEKNGDIFERISGTNGIFGTMDTTWLIDVERGTTYAQFHITGRDIQEYDMIIDFNEKTMKWEYRGTRAEMEETRTQNAYENDPITMTIKHILEKNPNGWTGTSQDIKDYSLELPKSIDVINQHIGRFISNNISRFKKDNIKIEKEKRQSSRYYHINKI